MQPYDQAKRLEAKGHDAEAWEASGIGKAHSPNQKRRREGPGRRLKKGGFRDQSASFGSGRKNPTMRAITAIAVAM